MTSSTATPSDPAGTQTKPLLTFGIEIEFSLATLSSDWQDPYPNDPRQVYNITQASKESPAQRIPADRYDDLDMFMRELDNACQHIAATLTSFGVKAVCGNSPAAFGPEEEVVKCWKVTEDPSIEPPDSNYEWLPIELQSPAYYSSEEALNTVAKVCEIIASNYRVQCDETAGIHVHVGCGTAGFSVSTLRKLMATVWTFEPQLDMIHPPWRVGGENVWCPPLRKKSHLAVTLKQRQAARSGLEAILNCKDINTIVAILDDHQGARCSYNLHNLREAVVGKDGKVTPAAEVSRKTIEFRHHESTLDPDRILMWIRLCLGMVEFADKVYSSRLEPFLKEHIDHAPKDFDIVRVLSALDQPVAALYYGMRLAVQEAEEQKTSQRKTE